MDMNNGWKSRLNKYNEEHNIITQPVTMLQSGGGKKYENYFDKIILNRKSYSTKTRNGIDELKKIIKLYDQADLLGN